MSEETLAGIPVKTALYLVVRAYPESGYVESASPRTFLLRLTGQDLRTMSALRDESVQAADASRHHLISIEFRWDGQLMEHHQFDTEKLPDDLARMFDEQQWVVVDREVGVRGMAVGEDGWTVGSIHVDATTFRFEFLDDIDEVIYETMPIDWERVDEWVAGLPAESGS
jgi:hypothetical protein